MTLTVKEKEHWKERISRKITQAIDALCAESDPGFRERIRISARQRAVESLGIAESQARVAEIKSTKEALDTEERSLIRTMAAKVVKAENYSDSTYMQQTAVDNAIRDRQTVHEKELLAADPLGKKILDFQLEQEDLLDTVWLATSPVQIKQLWSRVGEILNQQPTALQTHALSLEPVTDDSGV
jgi:hypothetical protein